MIPTTATDTRPAEVKQRGWISRFFSPTDEPQLQAHKNSLDLSARQRLTTWIGILAAAGCAATLLVADRNLDLAITALIIIAATLLLLVIHGRFPRSLGIGSVSIDLESAEVADLITALRDNGVDGETERTILEFLADKTGRKDIVSKGEQEADDLSSTAGLVANTSSQGETWDILKTLERLATRGQVKTNEPIQTGTGRGKPPHVGYLAEIGNMKYSVDEVRSLSPSALDLLQRRLIRILYTGTPVDRAIVIVPEDGLTSVQDGLQKLKDHHALHISTREGFTKIMKNQASLEQAFNS